ncbi:MAG: thioesterase [Lysobacterales bacterium]|jgi:thioesterase domain-containing protein|nr:MAG: thioesterase [Xanthomonadales bacterium]
MTPAELEAYLRERIPLSRALAVEVIEAGPGRVVVAAPLEPNVNHRETVFGGSAYAVAVLAAWSVVLLRLRADGLEGRIVIRRGAMDYERPIAARFRAVASAPAAAEWRRLTAALARGRPARVAVSATLECAGTGAGRFDGEFVVLPPA